jgi:thiol:disulfide interchange protein
VKTRRGILLAAVAVLSVMTAAVLWRVVSDATELFSDGSSKTLKEISRSVKSGRESHKEVFLQFGGPMCTWCKLLEGVFESDKRIAAELNEHYIVVKVDVQNGNNRRVIAKYGNPIRDGVPVTVFLDSDGKQLLTKNIAFADQGALSNGVARVDPDKVLNFLKTRTQERLSAR